MTAIKLLPDLFCFRDRCNVYVLRDGEEAIAIDFGLGRWLSALSRLGVPRKLALSPLLGQFPQEQ